MMNDRITYAEERIKSNFVALEGDVSQYAVSIDGEVIVWNKDYQIASKNYETVKNNIRIGCYSHEGLIKD